MITREQALSLISEHVTNKNIVKHMLATEALMVGVYDELSKRGEDLGGSREEWAMTGLLHDGDYTESVPVEKQGIQIADWAKEKGYGVPDNVTHAMASHNRENTKIEPENLMDWTIFIGDSLTGLIVASTLVLPDKKLSLLTPETIMKRFREKSFAKGTRREDLMLSNEKLGISLEKLVEVSLRSMQAISGELGL